MICLLADSLEAYGKVQYICACQQSEISMHLGV